MGGSHAYDEAPPYLKSFLQYLLTIKGRSQRTVDGYYIDLRLFLRYLVMTRTPPATETPFDELPIHDLDIQVVERVTLADLYDFLHFVLSERDNGANTRARKVSCLRTFYKYLHNNAGLIGTNPTDKLEIPTQKKTVPKHLTLEESMELLRSVDGPDAERDYCILTLFLNCGMRLSELVGINLSDVQENTIRITGKGNKERIVYLNQACVDAMADYLRARNAHLSSIKDKDAFFVSRMGRRISRRRVQEIVENNLRAAGLSDKGYSTHKLRHTAATLLYQHGGVDIRILKEMLGHENLATTEIYTHVSNTQLQNASSRSPLASFSAPGHAHGQPETDADNQESAQDGAAPAANGSSEDDMD